MLRLLVCTALLAKSLAELTFDEWLEEHQISYKTEEEYRFREVVYMKNMYLVEGRNRQHSRTAVLKLNAFADMLPEEFASRYLGGYRGNTKEAQDPYTSPANGYPVATSPLPNEVDWVAAGAVTPVKNQGQCGSCWSFSSTGSMEGAWFLKNGSLVSLSEQQLVDCSGPEGNMGCNGGLMDQAFTYVVKNGGICSEAAYPYTSGDGSNGTCHSCESVAHFSGHVDVQPNNETALMAAVAQQPVSVAVEADGLDWQFYFGGVVTDSCGTNLDHGVLVVGYGTDATAGDYWKVKNSWGSTWGEQGYIRLGRGAKFAPHGECGILMDPSYPVVA